MKIREDFVSNSSSTSFVVAVNGTYQLKDFARDLAKASINKDGDYHDKNLEAINEANVFYNLHHYELVFLGAYLVNTRERTYAKKDIPIKVHENFTFTQEDWDRCEENIKHWQEVKDLPDDDFKKIRYKFASKDYIDENDVLHMLHDDYAGAFAVDSSDNFNLRRDKWFEDLVERGEVSPEQVKLFEEYKVRRLEEIKKLCKYRVSHENGTLESSYRMRFPLTYSITMSTIKNTRDMIAAGMKLEFDKWEDLDELEKRLKAGEKLFCIHQNYSGGGYSKDCIYAEDGSDLMGSDQHLAMEYLHSECW